MIGRAGPTARVSSPPVQAAGQPPMWYRDFVSCLQSTFASVLLSRGHEPLEVLGSGWEFLHRPGDVRGEEFYHPCRWPGDLGRSMAPHHQLRSRWLQPSDEDDPLGDLAALLTGGTHPIAAVDNFHLPFRPAFHDVHAAHLVLVYGIDRSRGLVWVSDAMPPAFSGPIRSTDFLAAWGAADSSDDEQDAFFRSGCSDRRFLTVEAGEVTRLDAERLRAVLRANLAGLADDPDDADGVAWAGLPGLRRYVDRVVAQARSGARQPIHEVYPFGWAQQAQAALHGELLRRCGATWDVAELREAGRAVESAAHAWTGLRVTAAHGWPDPRPVAEYLEHHGTRLRRRYEIAVDLVRRAVDAL